MPTELGNYKKLTFNLGLTVARSRIFFSDEVSAFAWNISIILVFGRNRAITIGVAEVLKKWILIPLSIIVLPEFFITSLSIIGNRIVNMSCNNSYAVA